LRSIHVARGFTGDDQKANRVHGMKFFDVGFEAVAG
jgi:hypothetical protein